MWDKLFASADLLQKGMQASWMRGAVIRNNIANYETPGFKASDVEFESILLDAIDTGGFKGKMTREKHIPIGGIDIDSVVPIQEQRKGLSMRMDENNVDIEAENVKLAQNQLQYNTLMAKLNSELVRIKLAVSDAR